MTHWKVGGFYLQKTENEFFGFKVLQLEENSLLARVYWPFLETTSKENWDIQSACTRITFPLQNVDFIDFEVITFEDEAEVIQFLKIEKAKQLRQTEFVLLTELAKDAFQEKRFEECVQMLTEAAPYSKLNLEIYLLRAKANLALENLFEAKQDIFYLLDESPKNEEYLELKKQLLAKEKN